MNAARLYKSAQRFGRNSRNGIENWTVVMQFFLRVCFEDHYIGEASKKLRSMRQEQVLELLDCSFLDEGVRISENF